ncbi:MAG: hypothetical protein JNM43_03535 [Planctomycetaceae bacterium]|nr:hypothetical protein [Planctomycetaceae bacterium]
MLRSLLSGMMIFGLLGCGGGYSQESEAVSTVSASGTLTYKGKPLSGFVVAFQPSGGQRAAMGVTDEAGKFVLGTNAKDDGAVPGPNKVSVVWQPPEDDGMGNVIDDPSKLPKPPVQIPVMYSSPETSGLLVDVPEGGSSELVVELK